MQVHNTLSGRVEELAPRREGQISMYVCGATVQSEPHLGHGRFAVVFDVIRRYLEWRGLEVVYVRNVTDVEDKIIAAAAERGMTTQQLADIVAKSFEETFEALGVRAPTIEPRATEHIPQMLDLIQRLIDRGHAYVAGGDVYFSVRSFDGYGKLSGHNVDDLRAGARVEPGEAKRDPLDFALWKAAKPGEPSWDSPWGPGRPGWHIECSAMSLEYLGPGFDVHAGGSDLIFPHHENEIAQSEGATGEPFARYWLHNGMINLSGEKMSKSTGHIVDLAEAIERFSPMAVRLFYLRAHYRSPLEHSGELLADARAAVARLWAFRRRVAGPVSVAPDAATMTRFTNAMDADFNTPIAVRVLFDLVREGNRRLDEGEDAGPCLAAFDEIVAVLGLAPPEATLDELASDLVALAGRLGVTAGTSARQTLERLIELRQEARRARRWKDADEVRDRLAELGIVVEDTPDGARWHRR